MKLLYQHETDYIKGKDPCFLVTQKSGQLAVNADQISDIRKRTNHSKTFEEDSEKVLIVCNSPWTEEELHEYIFEPEKLHSNQLTIYDFWAYWNL